MPPRDDGADVAVVARALADEAYPPARRAVGWRNISVYRGDLSSVRTALLDFLVDAGEAAVRASPTPSLHTAL